MKITVAPFLHGDTIELVTTVSVDGFADQVHRETCNLKDQAVRAALIRLGWTPPERNGWQPIDTAPINQSILVFIPNMEHYGPGIYRGMLVDMGTGPRWMTTAVSMGRDCHETTMPTHWMPLPTPPNQ